MEQKSVNKKISSLEEFEQLENISFSDDWNKVLLHKIELSKISKKTTFANNKLVFSLLILFCLNFGLFGSFFLGKENKSVVEFSSNTASQKIDFDFLSEQLFINPN